VENPTPIWVWFKTKPERERLVCIDMHGGIAGQAIPGTAGGEGYITRVDNDVDRATGRKIILAWAILWTEHLIDGKAHFVLEAVGYDQHRLTSRDRCG
jgi:hypothetical protein